jgi:hypothetical protein
MLHLKCKGTKIVQVSTMIFGYVGKLFIRMKSSKLQAASSSARYSLHAARYSLMVHAIVE